MVEESGRDRNTRSGKYSTVALAGAGRLELPFSRVLSGSTLKHWAWCGSKCVRSGAEGPSHQSPVESSWPSPAPPASPPQDVFSNAIQRGSDRPFMATVVLFDKLNTRSENQNSARLELRKFLKKTGSLERVATYKQRTQTGWAREAHAICTIVGR